VSYNYGYKVMCTYITLLDLMMAALE